MQLVEHISELRKRVSISLIAVSIGTILSFVFYPWIIDFLMTPFDPLMSSESDLLFVYSIYEGFLTKLKTAVISGILFALPVCLYQGFRFIFPALSKKQKWGLLLSMIVSLGLAALGFFLSYEKIIPFSIHFLTQSEFVPQSVGQVLNFQKNIHYIIQLLFYFVLLFQLPLLLSVGMAMNLIKRRTLIQQYKVVIIGTFVLSALVTPPDIVSQCGLAIPLLFLYLITIGIAKIFGWGND